MGREGMVKWDGPEFEMFPLTFFLSWSRTKELWAFRLRVLKIRPFPWIAWGCRQCSCCQEQAGRRNQQIQLLLKVSSTRFLTKILDVGSQLYSTLFLSIVAGRIPGRNYCMGPNVDRHFYFRWLAWRRWAYIGSYFSGYRLCLFFFFLTIFAINCNKHRAGI